MNVMSGLLSFLLFAGLFFLMMRFGCGAHAGHGGHGGTAGSPPKDPTVSDVDPVCGMHVTAESGFSKVYRAVSYRFCSRACLDKFDAAPDRYIAKGKDVGGHQGHPS